METKSQSIRINPDRLLSVQKYAKHMNVTRRTVYNWLESKDIMLEKGIKIIEISGKKYIPV